LDIDLAVEDDIRIKMALTLKIFLLYFSIFSIVIGQSVIRGIIVDVQGLPVTGANVYLKGTVMGAASDGQGRFQIVDAPHGEYALIISVIGYQLREIQIQLDKEDLNIGNLQITSVALQSQPIVVTASRYAQKIQDVPASIGNVTVRQLEDRNTVSIDKALQYVSGLTLTGDQISIRGSSGYSRGIGSRVMLLMDGIPYLTADTKETNFESISINLLKNSSTLSFSSSTIIISN
jgi:outer membrane receptor for ferrienterochelin and colicins